MRVLADTNLFIAYLLKPQPESFIELLFDAVIEGRVILLVMEALLDEIENTVKLKSYLLQVITEERLERFLALLKGLGQDIPLISTPIPAITRDPKDDYLIAYAVVGQADYLISGDKDLFVLGSAGPVKIVDLAHFRKILDQR